jgi:hypothetical protein
MIYDQIEVVQKFRRHYRGPRFPINLAKPFFEGDLENRTHKRLERRLKIATILAKYQTFIHKILFKIARK